MSHIDGTDMHECDLCRDAGRPDASTDYLICRACGSRVCLAHVRVRCSDTDCICDICPRPEYMK